MKIILHWFVIPLATIALLTACSKTETPRTAPKTASSPAQTYDSVVAQGKGFTVGAVMAAHTIYVLFDPQCSHCGHLWQASVSLHRKAKFVWMPVAIMNGKSGPQGAALMTAANPAELMNTHEASILAGTGGISAASSAPKEIEDAIKSNTQLFNNLGLESVPYIIAKNAQTRQIIARSGALDTIGLTAFLGLN